MEINPYQSPEAELRPSPAENAQQPQKDSPLKYIVAILGAAIVFVGAFVALLFITAIIVPHIYYSLAGSIIIYLVALLAILAAAQSFRATLRSYRRK
ncbi:MAG: hypothetical protein IT426_05635 [Pirellulales bacterium]|nr:hypothetical protein [Pirellulales bacterium]